jgi:hypothetical protein
LLYFSTHKVVGSRNSYDYEEEFEVPTRVEKITGTEKENIPGLYVFAENQHI